MEHHIKLLFAITCFVLLVYFVIHIISQNIPGMKNVIETLTTDSQHIVYLNEPLEQGSFYVATHTDEDNNLYSQYIKVTKVETIQNDNDDNYKISYKFLDEKNSVPLPRLQHITYTEVSGEDAIKYQNELTLLRNPKPFAPEGQAVRCTNEANTNSRYAIYRYTDGHLRHYPNPTIAASWDKNWGNPSNLDCTNISRGSPMALEPSNAPPRPAPAPAPAKVTCQNTSEDGMPLTRFKINKVQYKGFAVYPRDNVFKAGSCYQIFQNGIKDGVTYINVLRIDPGSHHRKDVITYIPVHPSIHPLLKSYTLMTVSPAAAGCFGTQAFTV